MNINAAWSRPIELIASADGEVGYTLDLQEIPEEAGAYVFFRQHGETVEPIYVGETQGLRGRIKLHLDSLPLMKSIRAAKSGGRFLIYCTVTATSVKKAKRQVQIIEKALIMHAQTDGHALINKKGTKLPVDEINFTGNRVSEAIAPRKMLIKRALTARKPKPKSK